MRIFVIAKALIMGYSVRQINQLTQIDRWFLHKLKHIIDIDQRLREFHQVSELTQFMDHTELLEHLETSSFVHLLHEAKVYGSSDFQVARALGFGEVHESGPALMSMEQAGLVIRQWRKEFGILPIVNQIDTLAAEYPAQTKYLYLTYL